MNKIRARVSSFNNEMSGNEAAKNILKIYQGSLVSGFMETSYFFFFEISYRRAKIRL